MSDHPTDESGGDPVGFHHRPVMVAEVLKVLGEAPGGVILDATLGGGGHAEAILEARQDIRIVGIDRDDHVLDGLGIDGLAGFLFDLGVSSPQLEHAQRGFSYREAGPLDMRMDRRQALTADRVVNGYDEAAFARLLVDNADERHARRIARAVVAQRPISDTARLAEIVRDAIPAPARRRGGHPAKRTFQAIRIEVNGELEQLADPLDEAIRRLVPGGRGAVLSYHSGEDRIVKSRFDLAATGGCTCPPRLPCACGAVPLVVLARRAGRVPDDAEAATNPRATSARLRVLERR